MVFVHSVFIKWLFLAGDGDEATAAAAEAGGRDAGARTSGDAQAQEERG